MKARTSRKTASLTKTQLAAAFDVSLPTIDAWLRRGCPVEQEGANGRAYKFSLPQVIKWRESRQHWTPRNPTPGTPDDDRPDHANPLRLMAEEGVKHFAWWWLGGDLPRVLSGSLVKDHKLSPEAAFEVMQLLGFTLYQGMTDWIMADAFNETLADNDAGIDALWRVISGRGISTRPPTDVDAIKFQIPEWLAMKADEYVATYFPAKAAETDA